MDIFWLIDTDDFYSIQTKFYGWTISENNELLLNQFPSVCDGTGSYTYIKHYEQVVEIGQDFLGTQSIFLYTGDTFSAASNSFMRLVKYLVNKGVHLTLNKRYAIQYVYSNEEPMSFDATLVNEICVVPNWFTIFLDKSGKINFKKNNYHINEYTMDDENGLSIIDKWYEKWINVYRNIAKSDYEILLDLSGGFDSRISFSIFNNANIDKNRVIIHSNRGDMSKYEKTYEDWEIASEILKTYKYDRINENFYDSEIVSGTIMDDYEDIILGNSKICDYDTPHYEKPFIHITGDYGGRVHGSFPFMPSEWSDHVANKFSEFFISEEYYNTFMEENAKCIVLAEKVCGIKNEKENLGDFLNLLYKRFYGKKMSLKMYHNDIYISPFMDPLIHSLKVKSKTNNGKYQLSSLIIIRHALNLINYRFQGERKVSDETKKQLFNISCAYPYEKKKYDFIENKKISKNKHIKYDFNKTSNTYLKMVQENKGLMIKEFDENFYDLYKAFNLDKDGFNSQNFFTPILSIITIMKILNK